MIDEKTRTIRCTYEYYYYKKRSRPQEARCLAEATKFFRVIRPREVSYDARCDLHAGSMNHVYESWASVENISREEFIMEPVHDS